MWVVNVLCCYMLHHYYFLPSVELTCCSMTVLSMACQTKFACKTLLVLLFCLRAFFLFLTKVSFTIRHIRWPCRATKHPHSYQFAKKKNNDLSGICLSVIVALKRLIQMPIHSVRLSLNTYRHVANPTEADIPITLRYTHHKD